MIAVLCLGITACGDSSSGGTNGSDNSTKFELKGKWISPDGNSVEFVDKENAVLNYEDRKDVSIKYVYNEDEKILELKNSMMNIYLEVKNENGVYKLYLELSDDIEIFGNENNE